jgi:hypothetical protein
VLSIADHARDRSARSAPLSLLSTTLSALSAAWPAWPAWHAQHAQKAAGQRRRGGTHIFLPQLVDFDLNFLSQFLSDFFHFRFKKNLVFFSLI